MTRTLTTLLGGSAGGAGVVDILDGASVGGSVVPLVVLLVPLLVAVVEVDDVVVY